MKRVTWSIDVPARTAREAARRALQIQRDPESIATVFDVTNRRRTIRVNLGSVPGTYTVVGIDPPGGGSCLRDDTWVEHVRAGDVASAWRKAIKRRLRVCRDLREDDLAILAIFSGALTDLYRGD